MQRAPTIPLTQSPETELFSYEQSCALSRERLKHKDDFATWAAETLHGSMRSEFSFYYHNGDLVARDGRKLHDVFRGALDSAEDLAVEEPQLEFEVRRRAREYEEYEDMLRMARGQIANTMIVVSDFPAELIDATKDVGGYNVSRKTAFLRVVSRSESGDVTITSQTLDQSDRTGLESVYKNFGLTPDSGELLGQRIYVDVANDEQELLVDRLTGVYDETLRQNYGGDWYAGRPGGEREDTYHFVQAQTDLLDLFVEAKLRNADEAEHMRGDIIATIDARYQRRGEIADMSVSRRVIEEAFATFSSSQEALQIEIHQASKQAAADNKTFSGCGMTLSQDNEKGDGLLEALGFGNLSIEDQYGPLKFTCQKGHVNTRPRNKLIEKCRVCGTNVKC